MSEKLTIAIPKGRILKELQPIMDKAGIKPEPDFYNEDSRKLEFSTNFPNVSLIRVRAFDAATFVAFGGAQIGVAGNDVLEEFDYAEVYSPLDLGIGKCRLAVAELKELADKDNPESWSNIRVATKYPNLTKKHFAARGVQAECIKLNGAMELAPKLGLEDTNPSALATNPVVAGMVKQAVDTWGRIDILCNVAGILRDRMIFNMAPEEWRDVIDVHLTGQFHTIKPASVLMRQQRYGRILNWTSTSGLIGNTGQANYGAAKAGVAGLTRVVAKDLGRYGVTANAICPRARTAMTADVFGDAPTDGVDPLSPEHVVKLVAYLASPEAAAVTGQLFVVYGPKVTLMAAPQIAQVFAAEGDDWSPDELGKAVTSYFDGRDPKESFSAGVLAI